YKSDRILNHAILTPAPVAVRGPWVLFSGVVARQWKANVAPAVEVDCAEAIWVIGAPVTLGLYLTLDLRAQAYPPLARSIPQLEQHATPPAVAVAPNANLVGCTRQFDRLGQIQPFVHGHGVFA